MRLREKLVSLTALSVIVGGALRNEMRQERRAFCGCAGLGCIRGQVIPLNPAHSVRGPKHSVKKGKTSVLSAEEMGILLKSISVQDEKTGAPVLIGLRARALIALMGYTFARVGAAVDMNVEDYYIQKRRGWVRLSELKWRFRLNS